LPVPTVLNWGFWAFGDRSPQMIRGAGRV
jgi:hypothetical protein